MSPADARDGAAPGSYAARVRQRWLSRRAVSLHVRVVLVVAVCVAMCWWQLARALSGNGLSWFYTFEWPAFALLAIAGWWHLVHEDPAHLAARRRRAVARVGSTSTHRYVDATGEVLEDPYRVRTRADESVDVEHGLDR